MIKLSKRTFDELKKKMESKNLYTEKTSQGKDSIDITEKEIWIRDMGGWLIFKRM